MNRRIGIYSGTFDPIHQGHLDFSLAAAKECLLDTVVFLPEPHPREKSLVSPIKNRLERIKKEIKDNPVLSVLEPFSSQFTVRDTLPKLKDYFKGDTFTLLVGSDVVKTFMYRWDDLDVLLGDCSLAIGMRHGSSDDEIKDIITTLEKQYNLGINYTLIYTPNSHLASSTLKELAS